MSGKINWIASYPKSGNTWVRAFLTHLLQGDTVDGHPVPLINRLTGQWATTRELLSQGLGSNSLHFTTEELNRLRPLIYRQLSQSVEQPLWLKTHEVLSPYHPESGTLDPIPALNPAVTQSIIYLVRNPLDIAVSYAHHLNCDLETSVNHMLDRQYSRLHTLISVRLQMPEFIGSWDNNVSCWMNRIDRAEKIPAILLRYEDLVSDTKASFTRLVETIGLEVTETQIDAAINATRMPVLQSQEKRYGFTERTRSGAFFRKGICGDGAELTEQLQNKLRTRFGAVMGKLGY